MHNVFDFIKWALKKAHRNTIVKSATYPIPSSEIGADGEWEYLFGSVRVQTNQNTLDRYYDEHYCNSMTRAKYDAYTASWSRTGYATDCQGLLDAWLTYATGEPTDINVQMNYQYWCTDKGEISKISRPYVIGEAVFIQNSSSGRMVHIGWICGFTDGGSPLVVEARSIGYGVVITKLDSRWTHRGLMTVKFDYNEPTPTPTPEPIKLKVTSPMMQGDYILLTQKAMNALGYTDADGKRLDEDGKCGRRTMEAVTAFANAHTNIEPETVMPPFVEQLVLEQYGLIVGVMTAEDGAKE